MRLVSDRYHDQGGASNGEVSVGLSFIGLKSRKTPVSLSLDNIGQMRIMGDADLRGDNPETRVSGGRELSKLFSKKKL
jgi:hypothetical protein